MTVKPPIPVSTLLGKGITIRQTLRRHPVWAYIAAFRATSFHAVRIIGTGHDSICLELDDGTVLKVTSNYIADWVGTRPFDVPVLARGCLPISATEQWTVKYYIQPKVETPVTWQQMRDFVAQLPDGFMMLDQKPGNLGSYQGRVLLLDPWAVRGSRQQEDQPEDRA